MEVAPQGVLWGTQRGDKSQEESSFSTDDFEARRGQSVGVVSPKAASKEPKMEPWNLSSVSEFQGAGAAVGKYGGLAVRYSDNSEVLQAYHKSECNPRPSRQPSSISSKVIR